MKIELITDKLLEETSQKAKKNARLRMNYNIHKKLEDPINRMLNALEPGTYIRPHRHLNPPKTEAYIVLKGELDMLIFDDEGNLIQKETLSCQNGKYGVDIPSGVWHSMIVRELGTVIYEIKTGPFVPVALDDFASWSPDPEDKDAVSNFLERYS